MLRGNGYGCLYVLLIDRGNLCVCVCVCLPHEVCMGPLPQCVHVCVSGIRRGGGQEVRIKGLVIRV